MADEANAAAADGLVSIETIEARCGAGPPVSSFATGFREDAYARVPYDAVFKRLCAEIGCIVAAIDYRLAPEARSPAAAEDGYNAYRWLLEEAARLGIDEQRIGIAGASGGGYIAAAATVMIRDHGAREPLFLALHYPMLGDRNETTSSHEITDIGIWDRATNILAWKLIVGDLPPGADVSQY